METCENIWKRKLFSENEKFNIFDKLSCPAHKGACTDDHRRKKIDQQSREFSLCEKEKVKDLLKLYTVSLDYPFKQYLRLEIAFSN